MSPFAETATRPIRLTAVSSGAQYWMTIGTSWFVATTREVVTACLIASWMRVSMMATSFLVAVHATKDCVCVFHLDLEPHLRDVLVNEAVHVVVVPVPCLLRLPGPHLPEYISEMGFQV